MVYTYKYNTDYDPAFPVVEVEIGRGGQPIKVTLSALIDSGADATMIPLRYLKQIGARKSGQRQMRAITGKSHEVDMYIVSLEMAGYLVGRLPVIADRQNEEMIVGRDVLNHFVVTLNGLASMVEVSQ
jgi:hypothetical protein